MLCLHCQVTKTNFAISQWHLIFLWMTCFSLTDSLYLSIYISLYVCLSSCIYTWEKIINKKVNTSQSFKNFIAKFKAIWKSNSCNISERYVTIYKRVYCNILEYIGHFAFIKLALNYIYKYKLIYFYKPVSEYSIEICDFFRSAKFVGNICLSSVIAYVLQLSIR